MPETPDTPDTSGTSSGTATPTRPELTRAVARQRAGRRRVAIAAAALVVGVVSAACSTADAATPYSSGLAAHSSGHSGHGASAAGTEDPAADAGSKDGADPEDPAADDPAADKDGKDDPAADKDAKPAAKDAKDAKPAKDAKDAKDAAKDDKGDAKPNNGLDVIGRDCDNSKLPEHTGFQVSPACVDTAFGEVAAADKSPSLLITDAPREVKVGQSFTLKVSTRNLVRDRFLGAAAGGYYLESSFLDANGIQRGHFHTACRMLPSLDEAPDSSPAPGFFLATQDNKGGAGVSTVDVVVEGGMPESGTAQCTSWAGDGSHRIPMMTRANQTPAIDSVRVTVEK